MKREFDLPPSCGSHVVVVRRISRSLARRSCRRQPRRASFVRMCLVLSVAWHGLSLAGGLCRHSAVSQTDVALLVFEGASWGLARRHLGGGLPSLRLPFDPRGLGFWPSHGDLPDRPTELTCQWPGLRLSLVNQLKPRPARGRPAGCQWPAQRPKLHLPVFGHAFRVTGFMA